MRVSAWNDGGTTYGIRVGKRNRDELFSREWSEIVIEIDEEAHPVPINSGFWNECPRFGPGSFGSGFTLRRRLRGLRGSLPE